MHRSVRVVISGRVQGVSYRAWTVQQAEGRGLRGWVRNRREGTVEAVLAGDDGAVIAMIALCRTGPRSAVVTDVAVSEWTEPVGEGFRQLPTA